MCSIFIKLLKLTLNLTVLYLSYFSSSFIAYIISSLYLALSTFTTNSKSSSPLRLFIWSASEAQTFAYATSLSCKGYGGTFP